MTDGVEYPSAEEIHAMHERIVARSDETDSGIRTPTAVESALIYISEGYFGERPETVHEKAAHLMRLVVADHPYVDGNKRAALAATAYLYDLNGYLLEVGDEIRVHLRAFAEGKADVEATVTYLREHVTEKQS